MRPLMVLGTASGVGKSFIAAGLAGALRRRGYRVAPFKMQNMSLNSIAVRGGEIAYAQYVQAVAAGAEADVRMNPILLKPEGGRTHVVLMGEYRGTYGAGEYMEGEVKEALYRAGREALLSLMDEYDVVVMEGAGSPAEVNLMERDIANVRVLRDFNPVALLVADIERGGAFASIVGTMEILRYPVRFFVLNKFRGDASLLRKGIAFLRERYGAETFVVPHADVRFPEEDSLRVWREKRGRVNFDVLLLPHICNYSEFAPLELARGLGIRYVRRGDEADGDVLVIPGSKDPVADMRFLREAYPRDHGGWVIGICGGYQMLGRKLGPVEGLGMLPVTTRYRRRKIVRRNGGVMLHPDFRGLHVAGYEIHQGITEGGEPLIDTEHGPDGAFSGKVLGTYLHGLFETPFLQRLVDLVAEEKGIARFEVRYEGLESRLKGVVDLVEEHMNIDAVVGALEGG